MHEIEEKIDVENLIYEIRGKQVMLDSDLAKLYQCKNGTKEVNQAVKNNIEKFPNRFSFLITNEEYENLRSKILTSNNNIKKHGGRRYNIRVFTEQGVAMLATILKSDVAIKVSIAIMDAFVKMRSYISNNSIEQRYINNQVMKNTEDIKILQETFDKFKPKINQIYFNGQIYDAYSKIVDIISSAEKEIILIDNYIDKSVLDIISKINKNVVLITKDNNLLKDIDINKYNKQYHNLKIIYDNTFHDRYIILDNKEVYHCGASINHAGCKTFSINKIEDQIIIDLLVNNIKKVTNNCYLK